MLSTMGDKMIFVVSKNKQKKVNDLVLFCFCLFTLMIIAGDVFKSPKAWGKNF